MSEQKCGATHPDHPDVTCNHERANCGGNPHWSPAGAYIWWRPRAAQPVSVIVPSVGRVVHYVAYGTPGGEFPAGICRAAIITEVFPPSVPNPSGFVGLCVLNPSGQFFNRGVPFDAGGATPCKPGTWHWPERA